MTESTADNELVLQRAIPLSPQQVWKGWTDPQTLMKWFTPAPWKTVECEIDLRPGGMFRAVMESPEGERFPNAGCYLEVLPNERLVFTSALQPGYAPAPPSAEAPLFTAVITMAPLHADAAARAAHEAMGFHTGWSAALDQLVALGPGL